MRAARDPPFLTLPKRTRDPCLFTGYPHARRPARGLRNLYSQPSLPRGSGGSTDFTRFEHARMVGARALQISMGAPPLGPVRGVNAVDIAMDEYEGGLIPMTISRTMYARD